MKTIGDVDRFALGFELRPDPDTGGDPAERASWGTLQIWVAERNLTAGRVGEGLCHAAEVPLLPIVRWFLDNWDPMLHEERLPRRSSSLSAASWRMAALNRLPEAEEELDALLDDRDQWWRRHGLGAALPEYRIPDLHIRRCGTQAELSWEDGEWRTVPQGMRLIEAPGVVLLPIDEVAKVAFEWSAAVVEELRSVPKARATAELLRQQLSRIESGSNALARLQWAAGDQLPRAAQQLRRLLGVTSGTVEGTIRSLIGIPESESGGLVTRLTVPAMLLRSASPSLSTADIGKLVPLGTSAKSDHAPLTRIRSHLPPPLAGMAITEDGYERALEFRRACDIDLARPLLGPDNLETVLMPNLGIEIVDIQLDDSNVDGVAIWRPGWAPTVAINLSGRFARTPWGRRMTLAHELCHLLHDLDDDGQVGVVSNPWAPERMERRANAFAAMLLMPRAALDALLPRDHRHWTIHEFRAAMTTLGVGKSAFTWHLANLDLISTSERAAWLDEL